MIVVADTSPINYLAQIGHIDLLPIFYDRILVPPAVWDELQHLKAPRDVRELAAKTPDWLVRTPLVGAPDPSLEFLDDGEREAIALAVQVGAGYIIADETEARTEAARRKLRVIGTLGILRKAARADLLSLPEAFSKLAQTSFFVSAKLIQEFLDEDSDRLKRR
jgi:uncharacterized protein